ncbi:hypothetical protein ACJIZ3_021415 [Penstemon smallii]|uniref:Dihydroflavonol 4-reductase n=1 Tax=Penstemon smallii TaxID=265156 RepID=A0ABD3SLZ5_9LAMI
MVEYCVTGGTGFIAAYLIKALLERGHTVRTTVREPGFDEALNGVDRVFHTASPVLVATDENIKENLIDPCIKGTLNVLKSCKNASSVKRVVLTSSCSSIRYRYDVEKVCPLNESHWSDLKYCQSYNLWYAYAKTKAEQEAWKFAKERGIDLVVVNSVVSIARIAIRYVRYDTIQTQNDTTRLVYRFCSCIGLLGEYPNTRVGFVHIDDVVNAHILAMEESKASGRLICSNSVAHWSEIIQMLRAKYPYNPYENK